MLDMIFFSLALIFLSFFMFNWWICLSFIFFCAIILTLKTFNGLFLSHVSLMLGLDVLSYLMILLTIWIIGLSILSSTSILKLNSSFLFLFNLLILFISLIFFFLTMNFIFFYVLFETSLIPTLFLIVGWGYKLERFQAGFYLLFYTSFASLPLLIMVLFELLFFKNVFIIFSFFHQDLIMYVSLILAFLVKMPMFLVHSWLPKAHVEAPVSGSMILAGILLKLGGYGLIRLLNFLNFLNQKVGFIFISISLVGGFYSSLICIRQTDLKSLIAYSSISHMSLVICGIFTLNSFGKIFSMIMMVGHGLCSSALFFLANTVYERISSRSLYLAKGFLNVFPSLSMWWFLMNACNMASPPSLNLFSEIGLIISLSSWCFLTLIFVAFLSFFSAVYSLYLFTFSQHGDVFSFSFFYMSSFLIEFLVLFLHWIPLNFMFCILEIFY
uniref:NADH-ubiquinone oxidoreductase chain 4 n=1 Tax=Franklinothrips vespiformis TaxID=297892 RepID=A0A8A5L9V2_FRAVS|nr:NADH dehydrogenase subunit 4 [Franklinothrips vespiformis]